MVGVSSQTESINNGGRRFFSINPDVILSWSQDKIQFYGEVFGQSKTAPEQSSGMNIDAGILYLVTNNIIIDLTVGQRISGVLDVYNHYIGSGIAFLFG